MITPRSSIHAGLSACTGGEGVYRSPIPDTFNKPPILPQTPYFKGNACLIESQRLPSKPKLEQGIGVGMTLSALKVKKLSNKGRYLDSNGLYLYVTEQGNKSWVYRYQLDKRRRDMGLGKYPLISLLDARELRDKAAKLISQGIDPIEHRKLEADAMRDKRTFKQTALAFIEMKRPEWTNSKHAQQWENTLSTYAYPYIGNLHISDINTAKIRKMLEPIWLEKPETATRVRSRVENIIDYAIALDESDKANPAALKVISKVLPNNTKTRRVQHFKAMPYSDVPAFYKVLSERREVSANCLKLAILTATRTTEVRAALLSEFKGDLWVIPAERMKSGREHRIPLCEYVQQLIESIPTVNEYLFAASRNKPAPLSNSSMLKLVKKTFKLDYTVHGFRSSFRDWVEEQTHFDSRLAEAALAHVLTDKTEAAYQRGDLLEKRRELMKAWTDYVTGEVRGS